MQLSERTCIVTRQTAGPDDLIRFVRSPVDGQVVDIPEEFGTVARLSKRADIGSLLSELRPAVVLEVSRGGYFRAAEKKKKLLPAETVVWQSSGMASAGKSKAKVKKFVLGMLKKRLKALTKDWKKSRKLK